MPTVRLLPFETAAGADLMAGDAVLLESAAAGLASLRFYAWSEPTLSLGYFQPAADRERFPLPWLRRATGGAALVHHHEVTYAFALPPGRGRDWHDPDESWLCRMHHTIRDALKPLGITLRPVVCGEEKKLGPVLCFLHQTPADLLCDGAKVVGSAQRKQKGALLQHGGVLLRRSAFTPELAGLHELAGVSLTAEQVAAAVTGRLAADTGWTLEPGDWTAEERLKRATLAVDVYRCSAWNSRR